MMEPRNRVVQVNRFGDPEGLEVVDAPLPTAGRGEVRVRVLASSLNYTEVLIRRHLYPQTAAHRPPFRQSRKALPPGYQRPPAPPARTPPQPRRRRYPAPDR